MYMDAQIENQKEATNSQIANLKENMETQIANLKEHMDAQMAAHRESISQLHKQIIVNADMHHSDIARLTHMIDANTQDLRTAINKLSESFYRHIEFHMESNQPADEIRPYSL